ncbi:MAG TPA: fused isobutyryl-CoA mutase/GTPase IcmF [Acidimicrobiales bacterium]|nr:fused isobutyryl-CoA mutase/GTPase IcmF [Acidimicrobiales bacterium]
MTSSPPLHVPRRPVRFVTAASLFDGHDAAINIMRRLLQRQGAEVVHLGHNRSVDEVVAAAVQEDADGVAISSYQGGHNEYFRYLVDRLRAAGRGDVRVFGGGGGVIVAEEIAALQDYGVARIFAPEDGQRLGLERMVNSMIEACDRPRPAPTDDEWDRLASWDAGALARVVTAVVEGTLGPERLAALRAAAGAAAPHVPVLGVTGTGGSGKSSLTDELIRRLRLDQEDKLAVAVVAVDPTRRKGGGALLGDRIRMNAIDGDRVFFRSLATRGAQAEVPDALADVVAAARAGGADLVIVETPGIGQGDAAVVPLVDVSLYVMTPEFGAATQLEKIDMLDYADAVAINKFERRGGADALRDVRRQLARDPERHGTPHDQLPVFGTVAARFNDDGVTALYQHLRDRLRACGLAAADGTLAPVATRVSSLQDAVVPPARSRYLAEIADTVRRYHARTDELAAAARRRQQARAVADALQAGDVPEAAGGPGATDGAAASGGGDPAPGSAAGQVAALAARADAELDEASRSALAAWPETVRRYREDAALFRQSLSGTRVPKVALPRVSDEGDLLRWIRSENLPGSFPFTGGVFAFKRSDEDPTRMFAGEGDPMRTNRRFHLLSEGQPATRLSTAFDSVTLYGQDPDARPDIYGKVGNAGVSVATLEDMKALYAGFDLLAPTTSVSMTINGPAPTILAMFLVTATDQAVERFHAEHGRPATPEEEAALRADALRRVRGTVQADILKEDQGQNTCILSTDFSLKLMGDVQEWFTAHDVRHFYSASISGYHIAEAGANPITQLAFTLANGFTFVEAYLARGMAVDDFAPNLSFFFSNGMDPEYTVIGRVARRIWAVAMKERYGANARSQRLKYHIQTSGRSLHAQEMAFNDIRTTLQALCAIYDNANSLHTNAYDEAVTTPTAASVRRAMAIQMIINKEWGLAGNENPLQGSFVVEELTDLVERAVLDELDRLSERGGVLGAMETGYQRGRIQDESMLYEARKHDGSLPIVGVNTFRHPDGEPSEAGIPLARSTEEEKQSQLARLAAWKQRHAAERPAALARLRDAALAGDNVFAVLMDVVRVCSLGEITACLFEVGGRYRRSV